MKKAFNNKTSKINLPLAILVIITLIVGVYAAVSLTRTDKPVLQTPQAASLQNYSGPNRPPFISAAVFPRVMWGNSISKYRFFGFDWDKTDTLTMTSSALPAGLFMNCNPTILRKNQAYLECNISGIAKEVGSREITLTLTDDKGLQATKKITVTVNPFATNTPVPNKMPYIGGYNLPNSAAVNSIYKGRVAGLDQDRSDILSLTAENLPPGLELSCGPSGRSASGQYATINCEVMGIPVVEGSFDVTYTVLDNRGGQGAKTRNITVSPS